jgi:hypothetical protein
MKVIHITDNGQPYEIVELIANRVNKNNHLAVIEKDGEQYWTGGMIFENTSSLRSILDATNADQQYNFLKSIRMEPFVRPYLEELYGEEELKQARLNGIDTPEKAKTWFEEQTDLVQSTIADKYASVGIPFYRKKKYFPTWLLENKFWFSDEKTLGSEIL